MNIVKLNNEQVVALGLIVLAVVTRLIPHPLIFAPITGIALFAAARFQSKGIAI